MVRMRSRRGVILGLLGLLAALPQPSAARTILAAMAIPRTDLPWWRTRHEAKLAEIAAKKPDLIFLGDSITQDWERVGPPEWMNFAPAWQRFYGDRNAVNLGFIGDTTASLLWRIRNGEVGGITPKAAVVLIGANNFGRVHWSAEDTAEGIDAIIAELRTHLPRTKILLLAVLPSERSAWVTEATTHVNTLLAAKYHGSSVATFLDLTALFLRNGALNRELYFDPRLTPPEPPLHPTAQGQALLSKAMEPVLATMLGDRPH